MSSRAEPQHRGLTLLELALAIVLIAVLLSVLLPALSTARAGSYRERCAFNQHIIGQAWQRYLSEHNDQFPTVPVQPGWFYGGMRFSPISDVMVPDLDRPLTNYLSLFRTHDANEVVCYCPADQGIENPRIGSASREKTTFRTFGTSYRANSALLWWQNRAEPSVHIDGRGLARNEITTASSRLVVLGDPVWHEVAENTGGKADWHGEPDAGNLLFLDGSVRFVKVKPRQVIGPVVFDPRMRGSIPVEAELTAESNH